MTLKGSFFIRAPHVKAIFGCKKCYYSHPKGTAKSRIWEAETPEPIDTKFCMSGAVHDIITHANFCEDQLMGFGVASRRILAFSIDLLRRLECVIYMSV